MRISDWSSDVCSSDLQFLQPVELEPDLQQAGGDGAQHVRKDGLELFAVFRGVGLEEQYVGVGDDVLRLKIERDQIAKARATLETRGRLRRSEEHTSELQSLMRISYAVFCWKTKNYSYYTKTQKQ